MALLTAAAIEDYKEFTQRNIAYSRVKVGGTYYKLGKPEIHVLSDGRHCGGPHDPRHHYGDRISAFQHEGPAFLREAGQHHP